MNSTLSINTGAHRDTGIQRTIPRNQGRAIVMGGSMAGLVAARVLSNHFREIILVEQDRLANVVEHRRGVPQGRHAHGLLAGGRNALEGLFPGLFEEIIRAGAVNSDMIADGYWCFEGGEHVRFDSGLNGAMVSRPLLEGTVRERVRKIPNIHFFDGYQVEDLIVSLDKNRVVGINLGDSAMPADLVVDATGLGSRSTTWLQTMGYERPKEERIEVNIAYVTRQFCRAPGQLNGALFASIPATPATRSGGVILAQEENLWAVTMTSYGSVVPTELAGFVEYAKRLPYPHIHDVISQAEPVGEAWAARFPASLRRRYEYMRRFPEGYLVTGDAISSFNPVYGQGMSVAALEAIELDKALRHGTANLARRFFAAAAKVVDVPWSMAAGNDLRMPGVAGPKTLITRFLNWYIARLHAGAHSDPRIVIAFHNAANLLAPPQSMLEPRLIARVLSGALSRRVAKNRASRLEAAAKGAF